MSRTGNKGFTLIEVMAAVVILSIGTLMIQEGLLRSVDVFNRHSNMLKAQIWMDNKMGEVRRDLLFSEFPNMGQNSGNFTWQGRRFRWSASTDQSAVGKDLYKIDLSVAWEESGRARSLVRQSYAFKPAFD